MKLGSALKYKAYPTNQMLLQQKVKSRDIAARRQTQQPARLPTVINTAVVTHHSNFSSSADGQIQVKIPERISKELKIDLCVERICLQNFKRFKNFKDLIPPCRHVALFPGNIVQRQN
jgi:hypothetical protein